ncbi:uncharacterized protein LY89DRAFT_667247 [Mollisia scopiformis]|uniref:Uncharacterized protein n=1 Tax=Mollisia scopiformis TaxID=149040 RepID=A0A194XGK0_MOLSC|nr:uncharacterized protein LY89DRAFT_667247 [Mollisia scopiformis]KUJ19266.1 hypothetical protein LY89DRAFT_667247 [Mollisia scopiformis]
MGSLLQPPLEQHLSGSSSAPSNSPSALDDVRNLAASQSRSSQTTIESIPLETVSANEGLRPRRQQATQQRARIRPNIRNNVVLRPIPVPQGYHELNYKPIMLETGTLLAMLLFNILCVVGLVLIVVESDAYAQYHSSHTDMRFVVRYVPTIVGTITTLMFRSMRDTLARTKPYICMASEPDRVGSRGSKSVGLMFTTGLYWGRGLKKRLSPQHQDWLRWAMFFASIPVAQITGYKAALFTASVTSDGKYVLTVHKSMAYVLISLYLVVIILTVMTLVKMLTNKTGLKWDPVTIADQLALFHGSNALDEFEALEQLHRETAFDLLAERSFRLGYWERTEGGRTTIWYGIGKISPPLSGHDQESGQAPPQRLPDCKKCNKGQHYTFCSCHDETTCTVYPWLKNSLFRPWAVLVWAIPVLASLCLCIYTASSNRVNEGFTVHNTWWSYFPELDTPTNTTSNSTTSFNTTLQTNITSQPGDLLLHLPGLNINAANDLVLYIFAFRTIPTVFASYFALTWFSAVDKSTRFSQPFANMYSHPASASETVLLDYLWGPPGIVTINAFQAGHYKVFWFSLLDLLSPIFPILVAGLFTITNTGELIVVAIIPVTFYFVLSFLAIYLLTLPFVWPRTNRRLLRWHASIADYVSLFYASRLLNNTRGNGIGAAINEEDGEKVEKDALDISGKEITSRHLYSKIFLEEKEYSMGFYEGIDGRRHWGLDRVDLAEVEFVSWRDWEKERVASTSKERTHE